jgi:hypothetical protein
MHFHVSSSNSRNQQSPYPIAAAPSHFEKHMDLFGEAGCGTCRAATGDTGQADYPGLASLSFIARLGPTPA